MTACVAGGLALAIVKAAWAPITTDEAWSFNQWVVRGFGFIWTDYGATNNHLLNTLGMRIAALLFGTSELALRLPALAGRALLLVASAFLARRLLASAGLRVAFVAALAFHPYLLDFGALARGYSLGMGLLALAMLDLCAALDRRSDADAPPLGAVVRASIACGLSVAAVPVMLTPAAALLAAWLVLDPPRGRRDAAQRLAALVLPAAAVVLAAYAGVARQISATQLYFGAPTLARSLHSLRTIFFYDWPVPQSPAPPNGAAPPELAVAMALALVALAAMALTWAARRSEARRTTALPALTLLGVGLALGVQHGLLGLPLPRSRTWLAVAPVWVVVAFTAVDAAANRLRGRTGRALGLACALASLGLTAALAGRIDLHVYWEWPEDAPLREVAGAMATAGAGAHRTSLEFPWPRHAPLAYYRDRGRLTGLVLLPKQPDADLGADFVLTEGDEMRQRYRRLELVSEFPRSGVALLRRVRPGGHVP